MTTPLVDAYPDAELAVMWALRQAFTSDNLRFVTVMPAGDLAQTTIRITRISGADRGHFIDHPIVDIDVFSNDHSDASQTARDIQATLLGLRSAEVLAGKAVIVSVVTINGPRRLPEANPKIVRMNATYELRIHPQEG